jgi:hypothetical protein
MPSRTASDVRPIVTRRASRRKPEPLPDGATCSGSGDARCAPVLLTAIRKDGKRSPAWWDYWDDPTAGVELGDVDAGGPAANDVTVPAKAPRRRVSMADGARGVVAGLRSMGEFVARPGASKGAE